MKKSPKITLSFGIVAGLLAASQVASAAPFSWVDSSGIQKITFAKANTAGCTAPSPITFTYTQQSAGKKMTIVKSADGFTTIKQQRRKKVTTEETPHITYVDQLTGGSLKPVTLTGTVLFKNTPNALADTIASNKGTATWTPAGATAACSTTFTIEPARSKRA